MKKAVSLIVTAGLALSLVSPTSSMGSSTPTWANATFDSRADGFPAAPVGAVASTNQSLVTFEVETPSNPVAFTEIILTVRGIDAKALSKEQNGNEVNLKSGSVVYGFVALVDGSNTPVMLDASKVFTNAPESTRLVVSINWGSNVPGGYKFGFSFETNQLERTEAAASVDVIGISGSGASAVIEYLTGRSYSTASGGSQNTQTAPTAPPAKYAGPEFSALSLKPVMQGSSTTLTGKRLSAISSIEIGGQAAEITPVSDSEIKLAPAAGLAPGNYDLVIYSSAGKLTHINAVRIQPALKAFSITSRSEGRISETQYYEHSLISSMQQPELNKARCIVNGPNLAQAKAQAERLCALVRASNKNIETTVIEPRSTVKNSTVFARVTYGWN